MPYSAAWLSLQWLRGASEVESADGVSHITFESNGRDNCSASITETRVKAGPNFWIKESFSLGDIDPDDIQVENLGKGDFEKFLAGQSVVRFHTTNYTDKIIHTSSSHAEPIPASDYSVPTNDWFAPRFARALKHGNFAGASGHPSNGRERVKKVGALSR
jgi:hypothetical protein